MQILIDIPDNNYLKIQNFPEGVTDFRTTEMLYRAVRNGTPLPKGHGRLIDADEIIEAEEIVDDSFEWGVYVVKTKYIRNAPTIIEADKAESEVRE